MTIRQALHAAADLLADAIEAELYESRPRPRAKGRGALAPKQAPKLRVVPSELHRARARQILGIHGKRGAE